jgi:acyl dehydratase
MSLEKARAVLQAHIGKEIHASDWLVVTQQRVDAFADGTDDHQWIHVDPERAALESPYQSAIAHGYLTLSLYPALRGLVEESRPMFAGIRQVINYGANKVRFPNAVRVGSRVRCHVVVLGVEDVPGGLQMTEHFTVEIEGETKPACVAELIMRLYF